MTYTNPPASGTYWVTDTLANAGFAPNAFAAEGVGFASIKPLMNLWKIFRDIAYLLIVLVLVSIGFMIMFRVKMNPQTVVSVENSLPKIVIALLLITFSFPIAGFLIDAMYLVIILMVSVLSNNNTYYSAAQYQNIFLQSNFGTIWANAIPLPKSLVNLVGLPSVELCRRRISTPLSESINTWIRGITGIFAGGYVLNLILSIYQATGVKEWLGNIAAATVSPGTITNAITGLFSNYSLFYLY